MYDAKRWQLSANAPVVAREPAPAKASAKRKAAAASAAGASALQPHIESRILLLREQRVMLDADLATLYGVETRVLVQAVKRKLARFPANFMFQLNAAEWAALRSRL
jgi:hypothetical protein